MKKISVRITDKQHSELTDRSDVEEITISEQIRKAINIYLNPTIEFENIKYLWKSLAETNKIFGEIERLERKHGKS